MDETKLCIKAQEIRDQVSLISEPIVDNRYYEDLNIQYELFSSQVFWRNKVYD